MVSVTGLLPVLLWDPQNWHDLQWLTCSGGSCGVGDSDCRFQGTTPRPNCGTELVTPERVFQGTTPRPTCGAELVTPERVFQGTTPVLPVGPNW